MIVEEFDYRISLVDVAPFLRGRDHLVCLDSAWVSDDIGRYSYAMASPSVVMTSECEVGTTGRKCVTRLRAGVVDESGGGRTIQQGAFESDALAICELLLKESVEGLSDPALPPFRGGWAGYVGYDYGAWCEGIEAVVRAQPQIPQLVLCWYDWVLSWDHLLQRAWLIVRSSQPDGESVTHAVAELQSDKDVRIRRIPTPAARLLSELRRDLAATARGAEANVKLQDAHNAAGPRGRERHRDSSGTAASGLVSNFSREGYMSAVQSVRELILAGDIFQANISQCFSASHRGDAWRLYTRLRDESPASFAAFLEFDGSAILSSSPEMFLRVGSDGAVETRPIKGTRPRGSSAADDSRLSAELLASEKDKSENLMIVDLLRNDLSRVCEPGSVFVPALFTLERLATVQHLVSTVRGRLRSDASAVDLFRACFPGGSITGAPKTRAMQIISAVEGIGRGAYCGSIGYFAADGGALFNIAIRTLTLAAGVATFSAGGGIVLDSDPAAEYDETVAKAQGMARAIGDVSLVHLEGQVDLSPAQR